MKSGKYITKTIYTTAAIAGLSFLLGYASPDIADAATKSKTKTTKNINNTIRPARLETVAQVESANLELRSIDKGYNLEKFVKEKGMCDSTIPAKGKNKGKRVYDCKPVMQEIFAENEALHLAKRNDDGTMNPSARFMAFQYVNKKGKNVYVAISHKDLDKKIDKIKRKIESGKYRFVGAGHDAEDIKAIVNGTYITQTDLGNRLANIEQGQVELDKQLGGIGAAVDELNQRTARVYSILEGEDEQEMRKAQERIAKLGSLPSLDDITKSPAGKSDDEISKNKKTSSNEKWNAELGWMFSASGVNGPQASIGYRLAEDKTLNLYFQKLNGGKNTDANNTISSGRDLNEFDGETYTNWIRDRTITNTSKPTIGFGIGYEQELFNEANWLNQNKWIAVSLQGRLGARYNEIVKTTEETLTTWLERNNTILPPGPIDTPGTPLVDKSNKLSGTISGGVKATLWDVVDIAVRKSFDSNREGKKKSDSQWDTETSISIHKKF